MDISIIIPYYNESESIPKLRGELLPVLDELTRQADVELIFVDDGSTDASHELLETAFQEINIPHLSLKFESNHGNWGLGKAIRTGFRSASGEVIITTDSDGTYPFASIPALLASLGDNVDVITASPYHPRGGVVGVPTYRLALSKGSSLIYRLLVDRSIYTYTCLFRAYRRKVIEDIAFVSNSFLGGTELLVKCILQGYRVVEFPATLHRREYGESKARIMRTILAHLRFQLSVLLHRLHLISLVKRENNEHEQMLFRTKYSYPVEIED